MRGISTSVHEKHSDMALKVSEGEKIAVLRVGGSDGKVSVTELTE